MKTDGFPINLLDGRMADGEQRRPFPALGRELGDDVLAGETAREQPRQDGRALLLRELLALAWIHGVSWLARQSYAPRRHPGNAYRSGYRSAARRGC